MGPMVCLNVFRFLVGFESFDPKDYYNYFCFNLKRIVEMKNNVEW